MSYNADKCIKNELVLIPGRVGTTGSIGPTGPVRGFGTGSTGPIGPMGPMGQTGPTGINGPPGFMGPVGVEGMQGDTGLSGTGFTGPTGPAGLVGIPGQDGGLQSLGPIINYAYVSLVDRSNNLVPVNFNEPVPFNHSVLGSGMSYTGTGGVLSITTGGFYKIMYGFNATATYVLNQETPTILGLVLNGSYLGGDYVLATSYERSLNLTHLSTSGTNSCTYYNIPNNSTLEFRNLNSFQAFFQNNTNNLSVSFADGAILAYLTIIRIGN